MNIRTFKCDVCAKQRDSDSNHWFIVTATENTFIVQRWEDARPDDINDADFHLCGQEHLTKKVAEWAAQPLIQSPPAMGGTV